MSNTTTSSVSQKSAFKRPYKSRSQRRETDRRKYDESKDRRFLVRAAVGVGLVLVLALSFALKGLMDHNDPAAETTESLR